MGMLAVRAGMNWIIGQFHWDSAIWIHLAIQVFTTKVPLRGFEARRKVDSLDNWKHFHICVVPGRVVVVVVMLVVVVVSGSGGCRCGCSLSVLLICVLVVLVVVAAPVGDFQAIVGSRHKRRDVPQSLSAKHSDVAANVYVVDGFLKKVSRTYIISVYMYIIYVYVRTTLCNLLN